MESIPGNFNVHLAADHAGEPTAAAGQIIARDAIPCGTARAGMCAQTSRQCAPSPGLS